MVIAHGAELLPRGGHRPMAVLGDLRVEVATDALRVSAGDRAFDLLAALTLADVVAQAGLLLARAILTVADRDGGPVPVSRSGSGRLVRWLLRLGVRPLQPVAIVLAAISHGVCLLTRKLIAAHSLRLPSGIADELRAARRLLNRVLAADDFLLFVGSVDSVHRRGRRIRFGPRPIALLQVLAAIAAHSTACRNDRLALLLLQQLCHQLVILICVLVLIRHASTTVAYNLLLTPCGRLHLLHLLPDRLLLLQLLEVLVLLALDDQAATCARSAGLEARGLPDLALGCFRGG